MTNQEPPHNPPPPGGQAPPPPGATPIPPGGQAPPPAAQPPVAYPPPQQQQPPPPGQPGGFVPLAQTAPPGAYGPPEYGAAPPTAPQWQQQPQQAAPNYANFWQRLGATLVDGIVFSVLAAPFIGIVAAVWETELGLCTVDDEVRFCDVPTDATVGVILACAVAWFVLAVAVEVFFLSRSGQTPGRKAVGIKVVHQNTGAPISVGGAIGRTLMGWIVSRAFCALGYLWHLWDDNKQTWHDKASSSIVINA